MTSLDRRDELTVFSSNSAQTNVITSAKEAWRFRGFIGYMTKRELRTTYLRSYLGWIWSLLNPIAEVAIYSIVFGVLLGIDRDIPDAPNGFNSFPHFLMSGIATWGFFRMVSSKVLSNFTATVRLRRKLYFPPVAAALSTALSTMVEASMLLVVVTLFFGLWGHLSIHVVLLIPAAMFAATSGLGVGLALSVANSKYRDISYLYTIVLRLAFYMLPLIWPLQTAKNRFEKNASWLEPFVTKNPFAKMIEFGRDGLLYMRWPSIGDWIYLSVFSVSVLLLGWTVFARSSADVAEGL
ncbi:MAG: ABC-type polysaccharide/polyol phosphate export permease [Verrucomicrobiales bacterium]|jgi:ABC-type polysaccharide/polyol phosphate export permease